MDELSLDKTTVTSWPTLPATPAAAAAPRAWWRQPSSVLGVALAAAGLLWVLHDFEWQQLRLYVQQLHWSWVALAIGFDVLSYVCQGLRWRWLLKPLGQLSTRRTTQAVYAGLFTNEILPFRLGEMVRAYLVARWLKVSVVAVLPTLFVERLFDAFWLVVGIGLTALCVPLPPELLHGAKWLGGGTLGLALLLAFGIWRAPQSNYRWGRALARLQQGLQGLGRTREFYYAFGASLLLALCQALAFWLVMRSCGLAVSFWLGAAVYLIVHLGTAIPNAPANVGSFQFFTVVGLTLFGVDKATATVFSLIVFLLLTLPLLVLGCLALTTSELPLGKLYQLRQEIAHE